MAKAGTKPDGAYFEELTPNITIQCDAVMETATDNKAITRDSDQTEEEQEASPEYDQDSDDSENEDEDTNGVAVVVGAERETTFLIGVSSRCGRTIRFNRRLVE